MAKKKLPNPGSEKAVLLGCTCGRIDNNHGKGSDWGPGIFVINAGCPLHGGVFSDLLIKQHNVLVAKQSQENTLKPRWRGKMPAKERVIRAAIDGYVKDYPELAVDFDALSLDQIVTMAARRESGDTLLDFAILELNECMETKWSLRKCADAAWEAIEKGVEDLARTASAIEVLQLQS